MRVKIPTLFREMRERRVGQPFVGGLCRCDPADQVFLLLLAFGAYREGI